MITNLIGDTKVIVNNYFYRERHFIFSPCTYLKKLWTNIENYKLFIVKGQEASKNLQGY